MVMVFPQSDTISYSEPRKESKSITNHLPPSPYFGQVSMAWVAVGCTRSFRSSASCRSVNSFSDATNVRYSRRKAEIVRKGAREHLVAPPVELLVGFGEEAGLSTRRAGVLRRGLS